MFLYWFCVTSPTWISRSCGPRLVPERIRECFPFIYLWKHCTRRCAKHFTFGSLWLDVILFRCSLAGEKVSMISMAKVSRSNPSFQKVKLLSPIYNSSKIIASNKFFFQKTCYMIQLMRPSVSYDLENYLNVYVSLMKRPYSLIFLTIQYLQLTNKEYFTIFCFINTVNISEDSATPADAKRRQCSKLKGRVGFRKKNNSLMIRMIWDLCISVDQVWKSCVRAYACTCVFKQRMRMLLILAFEWKVWTRIS